MTEIFKEWSSGVKTHRDHFVVGFTKEEIIQRLRIFTGKLPDELVAQSLNLKDTGTWKLNEARHKIKGQRVEDKIHPFAYRPFDIRFICYESAFIDRPRLPFMNNLLSENFGLVSVRMLSKLPFSTLSSQMFNKRRTCLYWNQRKNLHFPSLPLPRATLKDICLAKDHPSKTHSELYP